MEVLALHIKGLNAILVNCYRPPQCAVDNFTSAIRSISELLQNLPPPTPDILVCGDFNFPFIQWPEGTITAPPPGGTQEEQTGQASYRIHREVFPHPNNNNSHQN